MVDNRDIPEGWELETDEPMKTGGWSITLHKKGVGAVGAGADTRAEALAGSIFLIYTRNQARLERENAKLKKEIGRLKTELDRMCKSEWDI